MNNTFPSRPQSPSPLEVAILVYPGMTALDVVGPHAVLAALPGISLALAWKTRDTVMSDTGISITPTATFAEVPEHLDVLLVGGGLRAFALMNDPEVMEFLRSRGRNARYVTSVCTGAFALAAAGLLVGYKATSHWFDRDRLAEFGAIPTGGRVVHDRNRITGGGVTAGIDFALYLAAELRGEATAKAIQLALEYDPAPPFDCGSPDKADPDTLDTVRRMMAVLAPRAIRPR